MKICTKCNQSRPLTEFYKQESCKDGLKGYCKHCATKASMNWYRENPIDGILRRLRSRAKTRGIDFALTETDIVIPSHCPVLNIPIRHCPPSNGGRTPDDAVSVDRLDNSKGYIPGNIRVISYRANALKSDATLAELEAIVRYIKKETTRQSN